MRTRPWSLRSRMPLDVMMRPPSSFEVGLRIGNDPMH
jgi:hypothetical protein